MPLSARPDTGIYSCSGDQVKVLEGHPDERGPERCEIAGRRKLQLSPFSRNFATRLRVPSRRPQPAVSTFLVEFQAQTASAA